MPTDYIRMAAIAVIVLLFPAGFVAGCVHEKKFFDQHLALDKAVGEAQEARTKRRIADDKKRKDDSDRENAAALAALSGTIRRLRADANRRVLPPAPAASSRPELACFDRPELERALGLYREGVRGLADEGSALTVSLNVAKSWVKETLSPSQ